MKDILIKSLERRKRYDSEFKRLFGVRLSNYFDNLTGFDVIGFDDFIKPDDDESTSEAVERQYGVRAVEVIKGLIGMC